MFEKIAEVQDFSMAMVLIAALRAHGFHPLDRVDSGLPGLRNLFGPGGLPIEVPEEEADDARALAKVLLAEMAGG